MVCIYSTGSLEAYCFSLCQLADRSCLSVVYLSLNQVIRLDTWRESSCLHLTLVESNVKSSLGR